MLMPDEVLREEWFVSQQFHGGGDWIVHQRGGNRPNKIARYASREGAERLRDLLNEQRIQLLAAREALRGLLDPKGERGVWTTPVTREVAGANYFHVAEHLSAARACLPEHEETQ